MVCVGCEERQALDGGVVCADCLNSEPVEVMIKRYKIGSCWLIIGSDEHSEFCVTRFPDGLELIARPEPTVPSKHVFDDPWTQCWTHEFLHNVLAAANGMPYSPALRFAAEKQITDMTAHIQAGYTVSHSFDMDAIRDEEWAVLSMQRTMAEFKALTRHEGAT